MNLWLWLTRDRPSRKDHDHDEAEQALVRAEMERERIEEQWPKIDSLRSVLRTLREKNHFIEGFKKTL